MVRIASSFLGAAIAFSYAFAAPAIVRRQGDITPAVPAPAGAGAGAEGGLSTIDPGAIPSGVDVNGSLGNSVDVPSETTPPVVVETPPATESSSSSTAIETSTVVEPPPPVIVTSAPSWPMYGSGSIGWEMNYNECIQTCMVHNPPPATVVTLPPHEGSVSPPPSHEGSVSPPPPSQEGSLPPSGGEAAAPPAGQSPETAPQVGSTGVTHEIIVEASAGSLRFSPAFVKANVGDLVRFTVQNGQHSIVESSPVAPCNATAGGFTSGVLKAGGTFEHVVDKTDPTFFFSDVEGECAQGLFGGINTATGLENSATTVGALMPQWAASNADIAAALNATSKLAVHTAGLEWGKNIETKDIPTDLHAALAKNILSTRLFIAYNPDKVDSTGQFNPSGELLVPQDINTVLAVADAGGYPQSPVEAPASSSGPAAPEAVNAAANAPSDAPTTGGAGSITSSRVAYAAVALVGALFMF